MKNANGVFHKIIFFENNFFFKKYAHEVQYLWQIQTVNW